MQGMDDTVSTISSRFTEFEEDYEEEEREEVEMKYVPPPLQEEDEDPPPVKGKKLRAVDVESRVKTEVNEEDVDDDFIKRYLGEEDEEESKVVKKVGRKRKAPQRPKRTSKTSTRKERAETSEDDEEDQANDSDWVPEEDDEKPKKKRSSGGGKKNRVLTEEQKEREKQRKRERRQLQKMNQGEKDKKVTTPKEPRKRKRVADMTPEEIEKERQRKRDYRLRMKLMREELSKSGGDDEATDASMVKVESVTQRKRSRRLADMTPEQAERERARSRARKQREKEMRAQVKNEVTEEEDGGDEKKIGTRTRIPGGYRKKRVSEMTEEERARMRQKWNEQHLRKLERKKAKLAAMTEEEREEEKQRKYFERQAKLAMMTEEEKEEQKIRARNRRLANMTEEEKQRKYFERQAKMAMMTPEERQAHRERLHMYYKRRLERLRQDPERYAETKRKWVSDKKERRLKGSVPGRNRRLERTFAIKKKEGETPEEQERRQLLQKVNDKRKKLSARLSVYRNSLKRGLSTLKGYEMEDQKSRERRCMLQRIAKTKRLLRKRLEESGNVSQEEIERQLKEVGNNYQIRRSLRTEYKPRMDNRRRVDENMVRNLEEELKRWDGVAEGLVNGKQVDQGMISELMMEPEKKVVPRVNSCTIARKRGRPKEKETTGAEPQLGYQSVITPRVVQQQPQVVSGYQQQQQFASPFASSSTQPVFSYVAHPNPPQFLPAPQHQPATSLQNVIDSLNYGSQPTYHHHEHQSTTSSQMDQDDHYAPSSYFDDDGDHDDGPPTPGGNYEDTSYSESSYHQAQYHSAPPPLQPKPELMAPPTCLEINPTPTRKRGGRPAGSKNKKPGSKYTYRYNPRPRPDGKPPRTKPRETAKPDTICPDCGEAITSSSFNAHRNALHNPNYCLDTRTCKLCGEQITSAQIWYYRHYLKEHVQKPVKVPRHICPDCGAGFTQAPNFKKHLYYVHGDGTKPENRLKCPVCPEEIFFKSEGSYYRHLARTHPTLNEKERECFRCSEGFSTAKELSAHVERYHPESFFPCEFCKVCKFTRMSLNFHYQRCPNCKNEDRARLRKEWTGGIFTVEGWPVQCEFCGEKRTVGRMAKHYLDVHNVVEEEWRCDKCNKGFRARAFWVNHLEEKHRKTLEEMEEFVGKCNAKNREGFRMESKYEEEKRRRKELGLGKKKKKRKEGEPRRKPGRKKTNFVEEVDSDEHEDLGVDRRRLRKKKRPRRKVLVICEEDEELEGEVEPEKVDEVDLEKEISGSSSSSSEEDSWEDDD